MTDWLLSMSLAGALSVTVARAAHTLRARREEALRRTVDMVRRPPSSGSAVEPLPAWHRVVGLPSGVGRAVATAGLVGAGAAVGWGLAGPFGALMLGIAGAVAPALLAGRTRRRREGALERQLTDLVEACALAVRSGLSIPRAFEFAAAEAEQPLAGMLGALLEEQRLGARFEEVLERLASELDTDDARLFAVVVGIHLRSGGNLAGALEEVAATIRHRSAVRRELSALSAQGRLSGAILGSLPVAFFLVLAATSRRDLAPVYRSGAGVAMVLAGLSLQGVAHLWIRRILKVEA